MFGGIFLESYKTIQQSDFCSVIFAYVAVVLWFKLSVMIYLPDSAQSFK